MTRRSLSVARCRALVSLLSAASAASAAVLAPLACSSSSATGGAPDAARAPDATADAHVTKHPDAAHTHDAGHDAVDAADAGCTVDAGPLSDAEIALGAQVVTAHNCQMCHGAAFSGNADGVLSTVEGGVAYPPNLTPDPATGLGCWTNSQISNAFLYGRDNQDAAICNPMPHFGYLHGEAGIDPQAATAVVQFLRSLPPVVLNVPDTPNCAPYSPDAGVDAPIAVDAYHADAPFDAEGDATHIEDATGDATHVEDAQKDAEHAGDAKHEDAKHEDAGHNDDAHSAKDAHRD